RQGRFEDVILPLNYSMLLRRIRKATHTEFADKFEGRFGARATTILRRDVGLFWGLESPENAPRGLQ
ncbi:hypothetical protein, partial [Methyloceanibacter sp.]|uniref:hypothetical protein n=1 Tax=Methyloceanibacter sp. TaxID=1965321 RepID=UPI003C7120A5